MPRGPLLVRPKELPMLEPGDRTSRNLPSGLPTAQTRLYAQSNPPQTGPEMFKV